jgi:hypothetical protein
MCDSAMIEVSPRINAVGLRVARIRSEKTALFVPATNTIFHPVNTERAIPTLTKRVSFLTFAHAVLFQIHVDF